MRAVYDFLRSRRLAIGLIVGLIAYSALATLLPLGAAQDPLVVKWAKAHPSAEAVVGPLGLHQPFTSPVFLVGAFLLVCSTIACSWERTQRALGLWRSAQPQAWSPPASVPRPSFTLPATGEQEALSLAREALGPLRLREHPGQGATVFTRYRVAAFGSPLFHWALVALFVFAALGQLMRSEGDLAVVLGSGLIDERASYVAGLRTGPLFFERFTGYDVQVTSVRRGFEAQGVARGDTPYVRLVRGDEVVAQGWVYPNHPLRIGSVIAHRGALGPAVYLSVTLPDGQKVERRPLALVDAVDRGAKAGGLVISESNSGASTNVVVRTAPDERIVVSVPGASFSSRPLARGEAVRLPGGSTITYVEPSLFAKITLVNDWSVPFIYAAFVLAVLGELLALFFPPRVVAVRYLPQSGETAVWIVRKKLDPAFPVRVERAFGVYVDPSEKERT